MDIHVYDSVLTYHKRNPNRKDDNMELEVYKTFITKNNGFWFFTHYDHEESGLNINKPYVHFHDGIISINEQQEKYGQEKVMKHEWKYNPKNGHLEAKPHTILFWRKPKWSKKVIFWGLNTSASRISPLGTWFYDLKMDRLVIILDYFPAGLGIKFVPEPQIQSMEEIINESNKKSKASSGNSI